MADQQLLDSDQKPTINRPLKTRDLSGRTGASGKHQNEAKSLWR
jgi:hypothetical protein